MPADPNVKIAMTLLTEVLPLAIAGYRALRDSAPDEPGLSDAQLIGLLHADAATIRATADDFLKRKAVPVVGPELHEG